MKPNAEKGVPKTRRWSGEVWGGLAAMLVALPSSVAFGVLTYTALGPMYVGEGAMAGLIGAAALGILAPIVGRTPGLISAPCAPAAAVLGGLTVALLSEKLHGNISPATIPVLLGLTALLAGGLQVCYGIIGGGRLIKFIPYPVVSGYLSGVGVLIALGQIPKLFGFPKGTPLLSGLFSPGLWQWQGLVVGLVTMAIMRGAPRITRKAPAPILGLLGGIAAYFCLASFFPAMLQLQQNPLIIGEIGAAGAWREGIVRHVTAFLSLDPALIRAILVPAVTLSLLLSIDTLKTSVVLGVLTGNRHNSDRELIGQGFGNAAASLMGGMPGAGTLGPTLVNITSGGQTVRSGVVEGASLLLAVLVLSRVVAWMPIGALAGILLLVAWQMFDKSMFRLLRHSAGRLDFAVIAVVILVAVFVDLVAASGVGVVLAILLFIRDQIRGSVIRRKRYLNQVSSKTCRLPAERAILKNHGDQGVLCELQGNLFFGTTDQLFSELEPDLKTKRFVLLDMRRVHSMDYTAAHLFELMQERLAARDGCLLFSGMPSGLLEQQNFERYLAQLGIVRKGSGIQIFEIQDGALEWIEERIIESAGFIRRDPGIRLDIKDMELLRGFDEKTRGSLLACMRELSVPMGEKVFSRGEQADEIFFVRRGSVRILLPLEGGQHHHLATIGPGDFFGELSFLDHGIRSADVIAKEATDLYAISRNDFEAQVKVDATFGLQVFARLAIAIAERLREADTELQALEER